MKNRIITWAGNSTDAYPAIICEDMPKQRGVIEY